MNEKQEEAKNDPAWEQDAANDKSAHQPRRKLFVMYNQFSLVFLSIASPYFIWKQYSLYHSVGLSVITALFIGWVMLSIYKRLQQES